MVVRAAIYRFWVVIQSYYFKTFSSDASSTSAHVQSRSERCWDAVRVSTVCPMGCPQGTQAFRAGQLFATVGNRLVARVTSRHGGGSHYHILAHAPTSSLRAIQGTALRLNRGRKLYTWSTHSWCKAQRAASDTGHKAFCRGDPPTVPSAEACLHQCGGHPFHHNALGAQTPLLLWLQLCFATRWHRSLRNALFYQYSALSQSQLQAAA